MQVDIVNPAHHEPECTIQVDDGALRCWVCQTPENGTLGFQQLIKFSLLSRIRSQIREHCYLQVNMVHSGATQIAHKVSNFPAYWSILIHQA